MTSKRFPEHDIKLDQAVIGIDLSHGGDFSFNGIEIIHHPSEDDLIKLHTDIHTETMPSNLSYQEYDRRYREAHKND